MQYSITELRQWTAALIAERIEEAELCRRAAGDERGDGKYHIAAEWCRGAGDEYDAAADLYRRAERAGLLDGVDGLKPDRPRSTVDVSEDAEARLRAELDELSALAEEAELAGLGDLCPCGRDDPCPDCAEVDAEAERLAELDTLLADEFPLDEAKAEAERLAELAALDDLATDEWLAEDEAEAERLAALAALDTLLAGQPRRARP